jgi:magnesium and cobalt transporter
MVNIANKNIDVIMNEIIETGKTRVPLYDGDTEKIIGFALVKDLFYSCSLGTECNIQDIIHPILEINWNTKAKDAIKEFKRAQVHIAKVVDDNKKFVGIITLEDIIEEVVGDILDEYDIRTSSR